MKLDDFFTYILYGLATCRSWVPGNQQWGQVPLPHLLQIGVRRGNTDLILCQCDSSVLELETNGQSDTKWTWIDEINMEFGQYLGRNERKNVSR